MQPLPFRLSIAVRSTFQAARPTHRSFTSKPYSRLHQPRRTPLQPCFISSIRAHAQARGFADEKNVDQKIEDIKSRIDNSIDAKAESIKASSSEPPPDAPRETIIHTNPESSSFVHTSKAPSSSHEQTPDASLPSSKSSSESAVSKRFSHLMDNVQANIFVASRRLNDLTGYSGIEALKNEISRQEEVVQSSRIAVRENRDKYAGAVATRSATQREVNDLLHRKHAWSPPDLERFTNLYRSDHANELAEAAAQQELSRAETKYEEASTKLARTILARYHEEQIWSDKIRQMSTWGTWGLMGLNVLLFVVFQIAIEPWRRKRLVKGFEDKVQEALSVQQKQHEGEKDEMRAGDVEAGKRVTLAGSLAELVVDSVTGASEMETLEEEAAVERVVTAELKEEDQQERGFARPSAVSEGYAYYEEAFRELFSEKQVVVTQRELTTVAIEGAAGGAALMGLLLVLLRPR